MCGFAFSVFFHQQNSMHYNRQCSKYVCKTDIGIAHGRASNVSPKKVDTSFNILSDI